MDLREFPLTIEQRRRVFELLKAGYLRYQPFIIADDIEGGAGQTLADPDDTPEPHRTCSVSEIPFPSGGASSPRHRSHAVT
jgi:hypothetical protein